MPLDDKRVALCLGTLQELLNDYERSKFYLVPPLTALSADEAHAYNLLIPPHTHRNLMDIQSKVRERAYATVDEFRDDVDLCFENSKRFCKDRYKGVYQCAVVLQKQFRKAYEGALKNLSSPPKAAAAGGLKLVFKKSGPKAATPSSSSSSNGGAADRANPNPKASPEQLFGRLRDILKSISSMTGARLLLQPVDFRAVPDYLLRIAYPMDLSTVARKLSNSVAGQYEDESYAAYNDFANDVRLIFSNFLHYNFHVGPSAKVRKEVTKALLHFESLWSQFADEVSPMPLNELGLLRAFAHLKRCLLAVEAAKKEPSCGGKTGTLAVQLFIDPVRVYFASDEQYAAYAAIISDPIDLGTVITRVVHSQYTSLDQVRSDVHRIASNCEEYWRAAAPPTGAPGALTIDKIYTTDANALVRAFIDSLEANSVVDSEVRAVKAAPVVVAVAAAATNSLWTAPADASSRGGAPRFVVSMGKPGRPPLKRDVPPYAAAAPPPQQGRGHGRRGGASGSGEGDFTLERVQQRADEPKVRRWVKEALRQCISQLKALYLRPAPGAPAGRVLACGPFLRPVDSRLFPDYAAVVAQPMDIYSIERKVNAERFRLLREALDDFDLIRSNAHLYNIGEAGIEVCIMSDAVVAYFRHLLRGQVVQLLESDSVFAQAVVCEAVVALVAEEDPPSVMEFLADEAAARPAARPKIKVSVGRAPAETAAADGEYYEPVYYDEGPASGEYYDETAYAAAAAYKDPSVYQRQLTGWEVEAHNILQKVSKHELVSLSRGKYVSNFFVPVMEGLAPERAAEYLAAVARPMDLETLRYELYDGSARSPQEFFKRLVSIFQNAIDYNSKQGSELERFHSHGLVKRCQHLIKYCTWVALEGFDLHEYEKLSRRTVAEVPGEQLLLTLELREAARVEREEAVMQGSIASSHTECRRLLKDVERCSNKQQKYSLSYFCLPVDERLLADYSVFVKKAVDLRTIRLSLEGPSPSNPLPPFTPVPQRYVRVGEFVTDMKLVFENAIVYNQAHLLEDTTGVSKKIYEAAVELQKRLLGLLPTFTLDLADKVVRALLVASEQQARDAVRMKLREAENREVQSYGQEELERLKREDEQFARDFDSDLKKSETSLHMKASRIAQHRLESGVLHGITGVDEYDDDEEAMRLADVIVARAQGFGASYGLAQGLQHLDPRDIRGYGGCTQPFFVPLRLLAYLESKRRVCEEARERWLAGIEAAEAAEVGGKRRRIETEEGGGQWEQQHSAEEEHSVLSDFSRKISISIRRAVGRKPLGGLLDA